MGCLVSLCRASLDARAGLLSETCDGCGDRTTGGGMPGRCVCT